MIWPDPTEVDDVYQPAEDSDLLAGAAVEVVGPGDRVLDVGTGSGYVAARAAEAGGRVVASDLNPHACRAAFERYGGGRADDRDDPLADPDRPIDVVRADLCAPFRGGRFDVVTFNPPYLPTDPDEERDDWMATALSGGESGREVIAPFLDDLPRVLAPEGVGLVLVSTLSGVDEVLELVDEAGFSAVTVAQESFPFETLTVLKLLPA